MPEMLPLEPLHSRRLLRDDEDRDQGDASTSQAKPKIARKSQHLGERPRTEFPSKETSSVETDLDF